MRFYCPATRKQYLDLRRTVRNGIILDHSDWDDWFLYETIFGVEYVDSDGKIHSVGGIRIGKVGMKGAKLKDKELRSERVPDLEIEFEELSYKYFSVGLDVTYYENLINLGDTIRNQVLKSLKDIAYDDEAYKIAIDEDVTRTSLLRDVSVVAVTGQLRRLSRGDSNLSEYSFKYTSKQNKEGDALELTFDVKPESNPSTNLHVIIGRNGVGKTYLMNGMINSLIKPHLKNNGKFERTGSTSMLTEDTNIFANLIFVSFSAFDENTPIRIGEDDIESIKYSYVGLKRFNSAGAVISKSAEKLKIDFSLSLMNCIKLKKIELWSRIIKMLYSDPIFSDHDPLKLADYDLRRKNYSEEVQKMFNEYSSGHRIVLLTVTKIIESIEEKSLIILDEPESHLHPPLLASFTKALSKLLIARNGVGIVATHSPVIAQEVPKDCIWRLSRKGIHSKAERFSEETFGENVGSLTKELFGLEVDKSGFYQLVEEAANSSLDYEDVLEKFDCELGREAQAIARTLTAHKPSRF